jgi:peptidoglycan-associated lipoprotein
MKMKIRPIAAAVLMSALAASGCHHTTKAAAGVKPVADAATAPVAPVKPSDEQVRTGLPDVKATATLATVFFDLDQSTLTDAAKQDLDRDAQVLRDNADVSVQIEGHCDERGSTQYNLALGEKRAQSVKDYLVRLGITSDRLETVSYGEERPSDRGHDESAWSKNRRSELTVTAGAGKVSSSGITLHD